MNKSIFNQTMPVRMFLPLTVKLQIQGGGQMKRRNEIICCSEKEMDRRADNLIEQGYKVERHTGVVPVSSICFPVYKVTFWK